MRYNSNIIILLAFAVGPFAPRNRNWCRRCSFWCPPMIGTRGVRWSKVSRTKVARTYRVTNITRYGVTRSRPQVPDPSPDSAFSSSPPYFPTAVPAKPFSDAANGARPRLCETPLRHAISVLEGAGVAAFRPSIKVATPLSEAISHQSNLFASSKQTRQNRFNQIPTAIIVMQFAVRDRIS